MILYAVICRVRDAVVLVECTCKELESGNSSQATLALLEYLRDNPDHIPDGERLTFMQRNEEVRDWFGDMMDAACRGGYEAQGLEHFFHVWRKDGVYYCCLSDNAISKEQQVSFAFLEHIQGEFKKRFSARRIEKANAYAMEKPFSPDMRSSIHHYNVNHSSYSQDAKVRQLSAEIEDLKEVMGRNINLALKRGDDLDALVKKSADMQEDAMMFRKNTNQLKKSMQRKNWCLISLFVFGGVITVFLIAAMFCGITFSRCASKESSSSSQGGN